jgi:hypothetical protein
MSGFLLIIVVGVILVAVISIWDGSCQGPK